jgi:hypothetical protein
VGLHVDVALWDHSGISEPGWQRQLYADHVRSRDDINGFRVCSGITGTLETVWNGPMTPNARLQRSRAAQSPLSRKPFRRHAFEMGGPMKRHLGIAVLALVVLLGSAAAGSRPEPKYSFRIRPSD